MKVFIQDLGYRGCVVAVAKDSESAKRALKHTEYDPTKPWDLEKEIDSKPIIYEAFGDR
jgi:hypothetical protein